MLDYKCTRQRQRRTTSYIHFSKVKQADEEKCLLFLLVLPGVIVYTDINVTVLLTQNGMSTIFNTCSDIPDLNLNGVTKKIAIQETKTTLLYTYK